MTSLNQYIKKNYHHIYDSQLIEFYSSYIISNTSINISKDILNKYNILNTFDNYKRLIKKTIKTFNYIENEDFKLENDEYIISSNIFNTICYKLYNKSLLIKYNNIISKYQTELIKEYKNKIQNQDYTIRQKNEEILSELNEKQYYQREYNQIYKYNIQLQKNQYPKTNTYNDKHYNIIKKIQKLSTELLKKRF
jgi:hypothetical protein